MRSNSDVILSVCASAITYSLRKLSFLVIFVRCTFGVTWFQCWRCVVFLCGKIEFITPEEFFPISDGVADFERDLDYYSVNVTVNDDLFCFLSKIACYKRRLALSLLRLPILVETERN